MTDPAPKKLSQQGYWRYVFAPMFLITIAFGLYILFTMNDTQAASLNSVTEQVEKMSELKGSSIFKIPEVNAPGLTSEMNSFNTL